MLYPGCCARPSPSQLQAAVFREWITSEGDVNKSHADILSKVMVRKPDTANVWTTVGRAMARAGTDWLNILKVDARSLWLMNQLRLTFIGSSSCEARVSVTAQGQGHNWRWGWY